MVLASPLTNWQIYSVSKRTELREEPSTKRVQDWVYLFVKNILKRTMALYVWKVNPKKEVRLRLHCP